MDSIIETTRELVSMETTCDKPKELNKAIGYIENFFGKKGHVRHYEKNGKSSLVVSTHDTFEPEIILLGHLDVVPAPREMFVVKEREGILRGRGVCDMKGEVAIMAHLLKNILDSNKKSSVALICTTDEEMGGLDGAGYLINEVGYRSKVAIVPDGGKSPECIMVRNKGIIQIKISAHGKSAHGSRPWLGENAIEQVYDAYERIKEYFEKEKARLLKKNSRIEWGDGEDNHWHHTVSVGVVQGGEAVNQVPAHAEMLLDVRFTEETSLEKILRELEELSLGCDFEVLAEGGATNVNPESPFLSLYREIAEDVLGMPCRLSRTHGADDGRFLTEKGVPTIITRPISGGQHSDDEWIDRHSMHDFYKICEKFISTLESKAFPKMGS